MVNQFTKEPVKCANCGKKITDRTDWYKISEKKELFCKLKCLEEWEAKHGKNI